MPTQATTADNIQSDFNKPYNRRSLAMKIFGALSFIGGGVQVVSFVFTILLFVSGHLDLAEYQNESVTTVVIEIVSMAVSTTLAFGFVILGVRLFRQNERKAALIIEIMIGLEVVVLVCQLMLTGINFELIPIAVNILILVMLQTYVDPSLREERRLERAQIELRGKTQTEEGTFGLDPTGRGYITLNFFNLFWTFVLCSLIGLVFEAVWHMAFVDPGHYQNRTGMLYGPFSPIYGVGAVLMTIALNRFHNSNPLIIFLVSAVIGGAFEYFVSWFMQTAFGILAWDYTGTFLSINGRTNGFFMLMWGLLGLFWTRCCLPFTLRIISKIPWNWRYTVTVIAASLMLADAVLTLASYDCWFEREAGIMNYQNASAITQFCNEHYDNAFMEERFQSMSMDITSAARVK